MAREQESPESGVKPGARKGRTADAVEERERESVIRSDVFTVTLRGDGVLEMRQTEPVTLTLEHARAEVVACLDVAAAELPRPLLVVLGPAKGITGEARRYLSRSPDAQRAFGRVAIVVSSPVAWVMATVFVQLNRPPMPIRIFTDDDAAVAWLRQELD